MQHHVARHLKDEVTEEKDPGPKTVHGLAELEFVEHLQLGKADVHPIQVSEHVAQKEKGDQSKG